MSVRDKPVKISVEEKINKIDERLINIDKNLVHVIEIASGQTSVNSTALLNLQNDVNELKKQLQQFAVSVDVVIRYLKSKDIINEQELQDFGRKLANQNIKYTEEKNDG